VLTDIQHVCIKLEIVNGDIADERIRQNLLFDNSLRTFNFSETTKGNNALMLLKNSVYKHGTLWNH